MSQILPYETRSTVPVVLMTDNHDGYGLNRSIEDLRRKAREGAD